MCIKLPDWVNFVAMQAGNLTDCELCVAWSDNPAGSEHTYKYERAKHVSRVCVVYKGAAVAAAATVYIVA